ncbi:MAG: TrmH family RNA methyltransferase [bacterium]
MTNVILIVDNIRSTHNVGSLLRTSDGLGIEHVYLCGITPYPLLRESETRLPHIANKLNKDIHKTALGAEESQSWSYIQNTEDIILKLKKENWTIVALEQTKNSTMLTDFSIKQKMAIVAGPEVTGIDKNILNLCDSSVEIPMKGKKESLNVSVAAAIALFWITNN